MKSAKIITIAIIIVCTLAISAAAQSVQSDYDRSFQFSNLKTFSFATQRRAPGDPLTSDTLNNGRIRTGLESQLLAHGFQMETEKPDFVIAYYVTTKNKLNVQDYNYGPRGWWGSRDIRVNQYSEGTLMVDFIDAKTNQVIWRGRASGTLELKGIDKEIGKATEKLVKQFVKDTRRN